MAFLTNPTSFRLNALSTLPDAAQWTGSMYGSLSDNGTVSMSDMTRIMARHTLTTTQNGGSATDSIPHLMLLVSEAVLEVVCVSLPGYLIAKAGMFNRENQKFIAELNVSLFTPCLIFTKLASQLSLHKMVELIAIPFIFVFMTLVSWCCSKLVCKLFKFDKRASNFVTAMGVFGNSNSLPISLVLSLSMTISGLHWDRIPGDNDDEVGARGILYLLIFQQLGQVLRWTWGYNVLLAPPPKDDTVPAIRYTDEEPNTGDIEAQNQNEEDLLGIDPFLTPRFENSFEGLHKLANSDNPVLPVHNRHHHRNPTEGTYDSALDSGQSGSVTPYNSALGSVHPSSDSLISQDSTVKAKNGHVNEISSAELPRVTTNGSSNNLASRINNVKLPKWATPTSPRVVRVWSAIKKAVLWVLGNMNAPLWSMLAAGIVACVPALQRLFFTPGTFIQTSLTRAVTQSGQVAVPLILVVLGANLANSTKATEGSGHTARNQTRMLIASILARMILPFLVIAPVLALAAKYINVSILDDPIFVVVCFLLTGAPSALQLAQICQINNVYEDVITRVLFWSYVVVILPSTLVLVITAIKVVHWAA